MCRARNVFDVFLHLFRMPVQWKQIRTRTRKYTCTQRGLPTHFGGGKSDEVRKTVSSLSFGLLAFLGFIYSSIQILQPTRCSSSTRLLLDVYVWFNMFRAFPHPSSGAYNCTRSLWFYRWSEAVAALLVVVC